MVADLFIVYDLLRIDGKGHATEDAGFGLNPAHKARQHFRHILGKVSAVRSRIGHQLLFIQGLRIIQRLLRGKA